ncbi:sugar transferase [Dokdonia sp. MED134]|uniref:undecaprenyl-phosphate glucose phosphotransferase n=1 Tax=Dokdonia sp. MED134 TaxID=313590 RepID=UPI000068D0E5|nr:undecaprenyl-phosphate glucose phosphotransferase [Dokdonia sp. MED134]EAQ39701.1 sugar transferase [Dokdonia sp. MED134]
MAQRVGRYSVYIRPAIYCIDLAIIVLLAKLCLVMNENFLLFSLYIITTWVFTATKSGFYEVYRYTRPTRIVSLILLQLAIFALLVFAFYGFFQDVNTTPRSVIFYVLYVFLGVSIVKFGVFYLLKTYRTVLGGNHRNVVILGWNNQAEELKNFFLENKAYGYMVKSTFDINKPKVSLDNIFRYVLENNIDEVYCSVEQFSNEELREISEFTDNNLKILKFIPDSREIFTKKLEYQYLGITPILSLRTIPIDTPLNQFIKRAFDIVLSVIVLVGVLSWLTPILAILIKLDSKGTVFFKQKRNGLDYHEFYCYKFRSMRPNEKADLEQVSKNDERITRVGQFLRKTSMDELPQFINVLKGDMSVVGPRPHMVSHTHMYAERIDKFMVRHFIKPGITGLAQVSGYRGEVETDDDIVNRVKFDIFYVENWSLFLDIKIVFTTIYKAIVGDEKAY